MHISYHSLQPIGLGSITDVIKARGGKAKAKAKASSSKAKA